MKTKTSLTITGALLALSLISGISAFAKTTGTEDPMAEAQAFLASPTNLSQAIAAAEASAGGKVSSIEYQSGENADKLQSIPHRGAPLFMIARSVPIRVHVVANDLPPGNALILM